MKNNSKQKKDKGIISGYGGPILVFVLVMAYLISSYGIKMNKKISQQVYDSYAQEVTSVTAIYNRELYAVKKVGDFIAKQIVDAGTEDIFDKGNIVLAESVVELFSTCNVYIVKNDNSGVDIQGNTYESVSEIQGLADSINELETYSKLTEDEDGHRTFLVVSPISDNVSLKGYVVIEYRSDIMETLTSDPRYSINKTFALVASDGQVIESCGTQTDICKVGNNVLDNSKAEYSDGSYTTFKQGISNTRTGHVRITTADEDKYLFYAPLDQYYSSIIMVVNQSDVQISMNTAMKDIKKFLITIGVLIGAVALLVIGIGIFNKAKHHMESEDLQYKADTDQLTDLYNKAATERLIKEYLSGDGRDKMSMMFVLDIDNFKKINDTQGHAFGDKVLSSLGHQIKSWFRANDIVGRIGGDEFIVFVKDIKDPDVIKREGSRIMQFFEGFNVGDYTRYSPTASVGGAVFPNDADSFETLYKAADKAVYKSKHEGKNRVSFYADLNSDERQSVGNSEDPESRQGD